MTDNLVDVQAERAVLGSALLNPVLLPALLNVTGVRPDHFGDATHAALLLAMAAIHDRGDALDSLVLQHELIDGGVVPADRVPALIDSVSDVPDSSNWRAYASRVRDLHHRRELRRAAGLIAEAADRGDAAKVAEAEALLMTPEDAEATTWTAEQRAERYWQRRDGEAPAVFSWPFRDLDRWTGGGLRRKQIVLIGGWTSNGKSIIYDQILDRMAEHGLSVHSYINEMSEEERTDRLVARVSGVPHWKIQERATDDRDKVKETAALNSIRVGLTECAGWTAEEIARHIKWNHWDVAGVDIVHEIPHEERTDERGLSKIIQTLRAAAKQTDCALIACVHLNDNRVTTPQRPAPVMRDVRGSGMLVRGADVVLLIHRDDNSDGMPTDEGMLFAAKIRGGKPNAMAVAFDDQRLRFLPMAGER